MSLKLCFVHSNDRLRFLFLDKSRPMIQCFQDALPSMIIIFKSSKFLHYVEGHNGNFPLSTQALTQSHLSPCMLMDIIGDCLHYILHGSDLVFIPVSHDETLYSQYHHTLWNSVILLVCHRVLVNSSNMIILYVVSPFEKWIKKFVTKIFSIGYQVVGPSTYHIPQ